MEEPDDGRGAGVRIKVWNDRQSMMVLWCCVLMSKKA